MARFCEHFRLHISKESWFLQTVRYSFSWNEAYTIRGMMPDAETALAMLSLEAATALVFAAGFLLGCLLTCCCLRCRKHAEPESQVTFKVDMPKSYPVPKGIEQCSKVYFSVSGSKVHLNPTCSGMNVPMSKDICAKCLSSLKKNKKA